MLTVVGKNKQDIGKRPLTPFWLCNSKKKNFECGQHNSIKSALALASDHVPGNLFESKAWDCYVEKMPG